MRAVGQAASGLVYGFVSLALVIGSVSLALAQTGAQAPSPTGQAATFTPLASATPTLTPLPVASDTAAITSTGDASQSGTPVSSTITSLPATAAATTARTAVVWTATAKPACGPPYGWVREYVVQPGDTLYRIATMYGVSVEALQRANCRTSTVIFVGERLWVPDVHPVATELTIIPTFPTPTEPATVTETVTPSDTPETPDS